MKYRNDGYGYTKTLLISRYPLDAAKSWIEANEKEIDEWNPKKLDRKITMAKGLAIGI
jgi:ABC-type proline/glycine betaine transport system substrate-binding protein